MDGKEIYNYINDEQFILKMREYFNQTDPTPKEELEVFRDIARTALYDRAWKELRMWLKIADPNHLEDRLALWIKNHNKDFKTHPLTKELGDLIGSAISKNEEFTKKAMLSWFKWEGIRKPQFAGSNTFQTLLNTNYQKTDNFLKNMYDLLSTKFKFNKLISENRDQKELEINAIVKDMADKYESLRNEIGLLLWLLDIINGIKDSSKSYLNNKLGPNAGLYKLTRKCWNQKTKRIVAKPTRKTLQDYLEKYRFPELEQLLALIFQETKFLRNHTSHSNEGISQTKIDQNIYLYSNPKGDLQEISFDDIKKRYFRLIRFHRDFYIINIIFFLAATNKFPPLY
jgi:hypothetical protein